MAVPVMLIGILASGIGVYMPLREAPIMEENSTQIMTAPIKKEASCGIKVSASSIAIMTAEKMLMVFGVLSLSRSRPPAVASSTRAT